jgi:hypothetical protein
MIGSMRLFQLGSFIAVAAIAACSPTTMSATPPKVVPSSTPAPTAIATSVPLSIGSGSGGAADIAAPIPAPSGYTSNLTVPIASAPAGTTVAVTSSATLPASLPVLSRGRAAATVRVPAATSGYTAIFFDSLVPSAPITVAGTISVTQAFPAGVLASGTQYYLGYYDSTQATPAWQTIAGPITSSDGLSLTFSGTTKSVTLQGGALYGFAIFSLAGSTSTPPPAAQTVAYLGGSTSIQVVNAVGVVATTLPIATTDLGLDDSGNVYTLTWAPTPAPGSSAAPLPPTISLYDAGSSTVAKSYTPSNPYGSFVITAGTGAMAAFGAANGDQPLPDGNLYETFDVWNPGASGAPSMTITEPFTGVDFGVMAHDGTIYAPHANADGTFQYDIYAPGSSTVTRTIAETVVPASQQLAFSPNYAAIGPDGTLYVTEYTFVQPDPLAGLYIYSPNGTETFVATTADSNGPGPQGVDVDASGNVYVVNNNSGYQSANNYTAQGDSLHDVTVYAPGGASVLRHVTGSFNGYPIAVASDGTAFISSFASFGVTGVTGTYAIAAGTSTLTPISSVGVEGIVLYDGNRETTGVRRTASVAGASTGHGFGGPLAHRQAIAHRLHH